MKHLWTLIAILAYGIYNGNAHAGPSHSMLGDACAGCHGSRGLSAAPMPIIAGLPREYLRQTLLDYRSGKRPSTIMGRIAKGYSEEEIDQLADFYASQEWVSPQQQDQLDEQLIRQGRKIHKSGCKTCHKNNGRFQDDKTPRLAGQWRDYLQIVFEEYWHAERRMPNLFMSVDVSKLNLDEIEALSHFYASQR